MIVSDADGCSQACIVESFTDFAVALNSLYWGVGIFSKQFRGRGPRWLLSKPVIEASIGKVSSLEALSPELMRMPLLPQN